MRLIYETDVGSATQQVTITGLDGDLDMEYQIKLRIVGNGTSGIYIRLNGDSTSANYGNQDV